MAIFISSQIKKMEKYGSSLEQYDEKINKDVVSKDNFDDITSKDWIEENIFELNWVYHFAQLKDIDLLFPKETFDGYEPRDQIFDIFKLLKEDDKDRYTQLFYETKKRTHDDSWEVYCQEIVRDTFEQVVMTVVASGISGAIMTAYRNGNPSCTYRICSSIFAHV